MWTDPWILHPQPHPSIPCLGFWPPDVEETMSSLFISSFFCVWNVGLVRELFVLEDANWILNHCIPSTNLDDRLIWIPEHKRSFFSQI